MNLRIEIKPGVIILKLKKMRKNVISILYIVRSVIRNSFLVKVSVN